jgi:hypothetical protein
VRIGIGPRWKTGNVRYGIAANDALIAPMVAAGPSSVRTRLAFVDTVCGGRAST